MSNPLNSDNLQDEYSSMTDQERSKRSRSSRNEREQSQPCEELTAKMEEFYNEMFNDSNEYEEWEGPWRYADDAEVRDKTSGTGVIEVSQKAKNSKVQPKIYSRKNDRKVREEAVRKKWSKEENRVALKCHILAQAEGKKGVGTRALAQWKEFGMFVISEEKLMGQIRQVRKSKWFTSVEIEELKTQTLKGRGNDENPEGEASVSAKGENTPDEIQYAAQEAQPSFNQAENREVEVEGADINEENGLDDESISILARLKELYGQKQLCEPFNLRYVDRLQLSRETSKINKVLKYILSDDITKDGKLIRAAAYLLGERSGAKKSVKKEKKEPWWKRRLEGDIQRLRKDLSKIDVWHRGQWRGKKEGEKKTLNRVYKIKAKGFKVTMEEMKQRITAKANRVKRYSNRQKQYEQNRLFSTNQKQFFKSLLGDHGTTSAPEPDEATKFWSELWGVPVQHNDEKNWIKEVEEDLKPVKKQEEISISEHDVKEQVKSMPNWKAPGPDGIQGFWLKRFSNLHARIANHLNVCITNGNVPEWMVEGRTTLVMKDKIKGTVVGNYRPIACLNLLWKLLTGVFAEKTYHHLSSNKLLPVEQKGGRRGSQGTKDHLAIDKTVLRNCKRRLTNLCMAWIDFKKAYDMVPHSWVLKCLRMFGVADNIIAIMASSMPNWKTNLTANSQQLGVVSIKRGIFQGDTFSPLLFVIALIPLTIILNKTGIGYKLEKKGPEINHLLFMDDLKLFAKNEEQVDSLVQTVHLCCKDIGMEFGISKCAVVTMQRGKHRESRGIILPTGETIADPEESGYKYLGILELDSILDGKMKETVQSAYMNRLKLLLKTKLSGGNLVKAINAWAVAVVRYSAAIVEWKKAELEEMDRRTRKMLGRYGVIHPRANVLRLYLPRGQGGRGLMGIEECVASERRSLDLYLAKSEEVLLKYVAKVNNLKSESIEEKEEYKRRMVKEKMHAREAMPLHGQFERDTKDIKTETSWDWLTTGDLKRETESLIVAAQDQGLNTNSIRKNIYQQIDSDKCRLCGEKVENVTHIVSACKMLAQKDYKRRHDKVCSHLHWCLSKKYGFEVEEKWYHHKPNGVEENENAKILWDFNIQTDRVIEHRRPDITVVDKSANKCFIIDVAIPGDHNVARKEIEKIDNYSELRVEIARMWNRETTVVPVVIGALGSIPKKLKFHLDRIGISPNIKSLQKSAILGSANILRKVLSA